VPGAARRGSVGNFVYSWPVKRHGQAIARAKCSPKRTANWAFAMAHARGSMSPSFSALFKAGNSGFSATLSVGKWPRIRMTGRLAERSARVSADALGLPPHQPDLAHHHSLNLASWKPAISGVVRLALPGRLAGRRATNDRSMFGPAMDQSAAPPSREA